MQSIKQVPHLAQGAALAGLDDVGVQVSTRGTLWRCSPSSRLHTRLQEQLWLASMMLVCRH